MGRSSAPFPSLSKPVHRAPGYLLHCCQLESVPAKSSSQGGKWKVRVAFFCFLLPPSCLGVLLDISCSLSCPQGERPLGAPGADDAAIAL